MYLKIYLIIIYNDINQFCTGTNNGSDDNYTFDNYIYITPGIM